MASNPQIILIDGPAGSGKTTFAKQLQIETASQLVHLDYVYDGWDNALTDSLTKVLQQLVNAFSRGFEYQLPLYNWHTKVFDSTLNIFPDRNLIIEGVGAGQSAIRGYASKLYWLEVDDEIGIRRVLQRDGVQIESEIRRWKAREAEHFKLERTREFADFIISTA